MYYPAGKFNHPVAKKYGPVDGNVLLTTSHEMVPSGKDNN